MAFPMAFPIILITLYILSLSFFVNLNEKKCMTPCEKTLLLLFSVLVKIKDKLQFTTLVKLYLDYTLHPKF